MNREHPIFSAHHKESVKIINKQKSIYYNHSIKPNVPGEMLARIAVIPNDTLLDTKDRVTYHRDNIKNHRGKFKKSLSIISDSIFSRECTKLCKIVGEVKNPNALHQGVILRTRF